VDVPQRIAEAEITVLYGDVGGLLEGGFAVGGAVEQAVFHGGVGDAVQGALLVQGEALVGSGGKGNVHGNILLYV
jgi:hypothetical protein